MAGGFCIGGVARVYPVRLLGWLATELCKVKQAVSHGLHTLSFHLILAVGKGSGISGLKG